MIMTRSQRFLARIDNLERTQSSRGCFEFRDGGRIVGLILGGGPWRVSGTILPDREFKSWNAALFYLKGAVTEMLVTGDA